MNKLNEIKAFIQKSNDIMAEHAQLVHRDSLYSSYLLEDMIEHQQDLIRYARRIGVIAVDKPFFETAEYNVLVSFDEFCRFINLEECKEIVRVNEDETCYHYSFVIDNIILKAVKNVPNEEHKKAQAI